MGWASTAQSAREDFVFLREVVKRRCTQSDGQRSHLYASGGMSLRYRNRSRYVEKKRCFVFELNFGNREWRYLYQASSKPAMVMRLSGRTVSAFASTSYIPLFAPVSAAARALTSMASK